MPLPAAALFVILASGEALQWTADVDTQARGRSEPPASGNGRVVEFALAGRLGLAWRDPDGLASLTWLPRMLLRSAISGEPTGTGDSTQQGGRIDLERRLSPTTRVGLRSAVDWGLTDFSPLAGQTVALGNGLLPSQRFVRTLNVDGALELRHRFSRRFELAVSGGFQRSGGDGHEDAQVLPIQVGAVETASIAWSATRTDVIALQAAASQTRFSSLGRNSQLSESQISWTSRSSRDLTSDVTAGVALIRTDGTEGASLNAYGSGHLGLRWAVPLSPTRALSLSARGHLAPAVDRLTGLAVETLRADGSADFVDGRLRLGVSGSGGRAVSGAFTGTEDVRLDAHSGWTLSRGLLVEAAVTAAWTNQLPFVGWQNQVYVGFRWSRAGTL
jgi:hypothetical protein